MNEQELPDNREKLFPKKGMKLVNTLFLLSVFFFRSRLMLIAYAAWIGYLVYCLRHVGKEESKGVYYVLITIASVLFCVNLYGLIWK